MWSAPTCIIASIKCKLDGKFPSYYIDSICRPLALQDTEIGLQHLVTPQMMQLEQEQVPEAIEVGGGSLRHCQKAADLLIQVLHSKA